MKRFIRYLYEYEQGRRLRNVGFVKVEQGDHECTLHIHGKGLHMKGEQKLTLYLFYEDGDECVGIWQGIVDNVNPAINYRLYYTTEDVGTPENFDKINGIVLVSGLGHKYAAVWNDTVVDVGRMQLLNPTDVSDEPTEISDESAEISDESAEISDESAGVSGGPTEVSDELSGVSDRPTEVSDELSGVSDGSTEESDELSGVSDVSGDDTRRMSMSGETGRQFSEPGGMRDTERENEKNTERFQEPKDRIDAGAVEETGQMPAEREITGQETEDAQPVNNEKMQSENICQCTKIQRNDLARLPRCEWKWANNSFLLHGYYNYHHLTLIDDGGRFMLGVPGVYHPQEAKAASVFGFTEFIPVQELEVDLTDDEGCTQEQFGYWCRPVKRPLKM